MVYQGSKARLLGGILPYIQDCIDDNGLSLYVEPFVGGANVIADVKCARRFGCDANFELISLLKYMRDNPAMEAAPKEVTKEHYAQVRGARRAKTGEFSVPYTAMVGYFASYGGRYFDGGYGRDSSGGRSIYSERLKNARAQAPKLRNVHFCKQDFAQTLTSERLAKTFAFVYCDPPYRGTKPYEAGIGFDYQQYLDLVLSLKDTAFILCSEYNMDDDFFCIWEHTRAVLQKSDRERGDVAVERLYTPKGGLYHKWWEAYYEDKRKNVHQRESER